MEISAKSLEVACLSAAQARAMFRGAMPRGRGVAGV
jgi:hypothetical protein